MTSTKKDFRSLEMMSVPKVREHLWYFMFISNTNIHKCPRMVTNLIVSRFVELAFYYRLMLI